MISLADDERAGGVLQGDLIRGMLLVMNSTSRSLGTDWWTDHDGWRIVAANISGLLKDLEPERAEPVPPFDPEAMAAHEVEYQAWEKRELYPLRERRNELAEKRKGRGSRITEAEEAEYHEVNRKIRQVVRSGGPKPNLSPKELERWEVERARDYRVRRAWLQATAATPSLFHEPSEYDYGA